jgi:hypothetical protein
MSYYAGMTRGGELARDIVRDGESDRFERRRYEEAQAERRAAQMARDQRQIMMDSQATDDRAYNRQMTSDKMGLLQDDRQARLGLQERSVGLKEDRQGNLQMHLAAIDKLSSMTPEELERYGKTPEDVHAAIAKHRLAVGGKAGAVGIKPKDPSAQRKADLSAEKLGLEVEALRRKPAEMKAAQEEKASAVIQAAKQYVAETEDAFNVAQRWRDELGDKLLARQANPDLFNEAYPNFDPDAAEKDHKIRVAEYNRHAKRYDDAKKRLSELEGKYGMAPKADAPVDAPARPSGRMTLNGQEFDSKAKGTGLIRKGKQTVTVDDVRPVSTSGMSPQEEIEKINGILKANPGLATSDDPLTKRKYEILKNRLTQLQSIGR